MVMGKPDGRGGRRPGSGRRKLLPEERKSRPKNYMRAWPDEWELLKRFNKAIRRDKAACEAALEELEQKIFWGKKEKKED